jgi:lysophospholipase L1-like esterase
MFVKRLWAVLSALALIAGPAAGQAEVKTHGARTTRQAQAGRTRASALRFDFGPGRVARGYTRVLATTVYSKELGYGFEPGANVTCLDRGGRDVLREDFCTSGEPFYFSVALPEGNYRVTVTLGDRAGETTNTVKAELRRLMLEEIRTAPGEFAARTFEVNVRTPRISTGGEVRLKEREKTTEARAWDEKLTLEFNGARPAVCAVEITPADDVTTVYLLGDSTVCDQPLEPYASWGQMLTRFFGPGVVVANHAESGESLRSSTAARRLDKVLSVMRPGDYLFIQYGHNDEKERGEGVGAFTTYKAALERFVEESRARGGRPVLVTPMQRRTFDAAGRVTNSHGDYPEAVRQAAREEGVPLIDLHAMSTRLYEALGPEKSGVLFKEGDATHHSDFGAYELARCVVEGIKAARLPVAKYLARDVPPFDPGRPDPPESFDVPPSPNSTDVKPPGS